MSFAREKRLLLGLLALLVPLPLPLNDAISWGVLLLFEMAVALYLHRVWRGHDRWLPNWALNLMGLVYLPLLALDILASGRAQALRPVLHLALYGLVAKLFSLRRERDKWQVTIGLSSSSSRRWPRASIGGAAPPRRSSAQALDPGPLRLPSTCSPASARAAGREAAALASSR